MNYKEEILKLKQECYDCRACPLGEQPGELDPHVFAIGRVPADIMFLAESPGRDEVLQKKPLVGRSGKFFGKNILGRLGLERKEVYITNTVLCRPPGNRNPLPGEMEMCSKFLDAQICLIDPKIIITLGNIPLQAVCRVSGITKWHGQIIYSVDWSNSKKYPVFPIFHPSYCLRGSGLKELEEDMRKLNEIIEPYRRKNE